MTKKSKKVLFVSYGGGHCRMIAPLVEYINKNYENWQPSILGLTSSYDYFKSKGLSPLGYKDFFELTSEIKNIGEKSLTSIQSAYIPSKEETLTYLGINMRDLIESIGEENAWKIYKEEGRHCFLPVMAMKEIQKKIKPDIVVTTSSPRSELASVKAAKELNIPTLSIVDLFAVYESDYLEADVLCVPFEKTKNILESRPNNKSKVVVTGNPNLQSSCTPSQITEKKLLWCDQPAYMDMNKKVIFRSFEDIESLLNLIKEVCEETKWELIVRPHPSQDLRGFKKWGMDNKIKIDENTEIKNSLLNVSSVGSITSTALIEAAICGKKIIKFTPSNALNDLPIEEELNYEVNFQDRQSLSTLLKNKYNPKFLKGHNNPEMSICKQIENTIGR